MTSRTTINVNFVDSFSESEHPRNGGKFSPKSKGAGSKKFSAHTFKQQLKTMPHTKLVAALNIKSIDPQMKAHIEKELSSRRGALKK